MSLIFTNARLVFPKGICEGWLKVENGKITAYDTGCYPGNISETDEVINCKGSYLAPGFIEMHTHGAGGADFMDGTYEAFETACMTHLAHGTTTVLPTALAATKKEILRTIDGFREAKEKLSGRGPHLPGLHMEGPYLCREQAGAIDPRYIRAPEPEEYEEFLSYGKGAIKRWTLAVENEGAAAFANRLKEEGILPSIGHSNAEYSQVLEAFAQGATHITHLYSAMSTITRKNGFRHSGVLESAFCIPDMTVEIIADGCHVPAELLQLVWRVKGPEKTALTCDSMRCAGQNVTESILGSLENGQRVIIEDDVAKMPDRQAFAGSIALDDRLVRVMVKKAGVPLHEAVRMMTLTPAEILGISAQTGSLAVGKDADLVMFDDDINIREVFVGGKTAYKKQ